MLAKFTLSDGPQKPSPSPANEATGEGAPTVTGQRSKDNSKQVRNPRRHLMDLLRESHSHRLNSFRTISKRLVDGDMDNATMMADALDQKSGGDIDFEMSCLVPRVSQKTDARQLSLLIESYQIGKMVLQALQSLSADDVVTPGARNDLVHEIDAFFGSSKNHARLLDALEVETPATCHALLDELSQFRQRHSRWTSMP